MRGTLLTPRTVCFPARQTLQMGDSEDNRAVRFLRSLSHTLLTLTEVSRLPDKLTASPFTDVAKPTVNEIEAQRRGGRHKCGVWCGDVGWSEGDVEIVEVPTPVAEQT